MTAEVRTGDSDKSPYQGRHSFSVVNPVVGTVSSNPHFLFRANGANVTSIQTWLGRVSNVNARGIIGLRLLFEDGAHLSAGSTRDSPVDTFVLERGDAILRFVIWAGSHIDRFEITPRHGRVFTSGGQPGGTQQNQNVGNGQFEGFEATTDSSGIITSLSSRFETFRPRSYDEV